MSCNLNASIYGPPYQQTVNGSSCTIASDNSPNATVALATCFNTTTNNIVPNSQSNWSSISTEQFGSYFNDQSDCNYAYCNITGGNSYELFADCLKARFPEARDTCFFSGVEKPSSGNMERHSKAGLVVLVLGVLGAVMVWILGLCGVK